MMKQLISMLLVGILLAGVLAGCGTKDTGEEITKKSTGILVMAAASLMDVCNELAKSYRKEKPNVELSFTFGSSGALQTQIEEGAPSDIFISAARKQMDALEEQALIIKDTRMDLLENKVVLIVPEGNMNEIGSYMDIATGKVERIALGEPGSVPAGQYSEEILTTLGIWEAAKTKAVYGSNVRQVLSWTERGEVDCGIVYLTDAALSEQVEIICEAPRDTHKPVIYPAAVLKESKHQQESRDFLEFLQSEKAKAIFEKNGFTRIRE